MSESKEIRDEEFRKWKEELDEKCEKHLQDHPEPDVPKPIPENTTSPISTMTLAAMAEQILNDYMRMNQKPTVRVIPAENYPGSWDVLVGNQLRGSFSGPDAQKQAIDFGTELLNGLYGPI